MSKLTQLATTATTRRYELIALITGFVLMAYELAASRVLAPYIGSSTYVWTSVIGVMIGALSAGYALGGMLADRRVQNTDVALLLQASALGVAVTLMFADSCLSLISQYINDPRVQGLSASVLLFLPASFALGMIGPYLARLRNVSLATTGRAVASLSALNAVGGILGTFGVGFILFGYFGTKQTLVLIIVLLIGASWLAAPWQHITRLRVAGSVAILLVALSQLVPLPSKFLIADIDTPSAHYRVVDGAYKEQLTRLLVTGPHGAQSGVYSNGSPDLVFSYTQQMAKVVAASPQPQRILILGGGAFTLPEYMAKHYPHTQVDVVEIDPHLAAIAQKYFRYQPQPNIRVISRDARSFLNTNQTRYDVILVDVYNETSIPFALATSHYADRLHASLQPQGAVVANVIAGLNPACAPLLGGLHASYHHDFAQHRVFPLEDPRLQNTQNVVITYSNVSLHYLDQLHPATARIPAYPPFTDNFAPVERFQQNCH
jgi:spermidine synthase